MLRSKFLKAVGVTLLALLLSLFLMFPFSATLSGMFSMPERDDFRMTDLYAQVADGRPVRLLDDRIILVDIGHADRVRIAEALEVVSLCGPKAVGIDVNFANPGDCDSLLMSAISANPGIVLPLVVKETPDGKFEVAERPFFFGRIPGVNYGVVNFPTEKEGAAVREMATFYDMDKNETGIPARLPSLVSALAMQTEPDKARILADKGNKTEIIDYASREFKIIHIDELEDRAEELTDKCVILGAMQEAGDMHATPINSYMAGMLIHAYSLSTVFDGRYLQATPKWLDYVTASLLCLLIIMFALYVTNKCRGLLLRLLQIVLLFVVIWAGYSMFVDRGMIVDLSYTVVMLTFGLVALDIWNGIEGLTDYGISFVKRRKALKLTD